MVALSKKTAPQGEELNEYNLCTLDNSARGAEEIHVQAKSSDPPKRRGRPKKKSK